LLSKQGFTRILIAIDGSDASMRAADHAARIAKRDAAQLVALLVVPPPSFKVPGELIDYYDDARKSAKVWMQQIETIAAKHGMSVKTDILMGALTVLDGILEYAQRMSADLIVTGSRGSTSSNRKLLGSVSSGLVEYANCAVLVVR
jgi:nucleotide-binding universal stress UspA family protein